MRIWKVAMVLAISLPIHGVRSWAQTVSGTAAGNVVTQTNGMFVGGTPNAVTPQNVNPNLSGSTTRPAVGQPGFSPAMPTPGATAINPQGITPAIAPQRSVTTAIGQQGFGGAIGEQGSGTAIGQQGSGTAIGQQGFGTAIIAPTNGVVIGQP